MLLLTSAEQTRFSTLPKAVTTGWKVKAETLQFNDSPEQIIARRNLVSFESAQMKQLMATYGKEGSEDEVRNAILAIDWDDFSEHDVAEFLFLIGPVMLSIVIDALLDAVQSATDVERVANISSLRHTLLKSFPVSA